MPKTVIQLDASRCAAYLTSERRMGVGQGLLSAGPLRMRNATASTPRDKRNCRVSKNGILPNSKPEIPKILANQRIICKPLQTRFQQCRISFSCMFFGLFSKTRALRGRRITPMRSGVRSPQRPFFGPVDSDCQRVFSFDRITTYGNRLARVDTVSITVHLVSL